MANLLGTTKTQKKELYTGLTTFKPICINPTQEQLQKYMPNAKVDNYDTDTATKIIIYGELQLEDGETSYGKWTTWGEDKDHSTERGKWLVNYSTLDVKWVDPTQTVDGYVLAKAGQVDLWRFLSSLINIKEPIDIQTRYEDMLRGNWREINELLSANLERDDQAPRTVKVYLGVQETANGNYQKLYKLVEPQERNGNYIADKAMKDDYFKVYKGVGKGLCKYSPAEIETENITVTTTADNPW